MRIRIHNTALYNHRFHSIVGCLHQRSFYREHIFRHLQPGTAATHNLDTWDGRMTRALVFQTNMSFHVIHASCCVVTLLARPLWHVRKLGSKATAWRNTQQKGRRMILWRPLMRLEMGPVAIAAPIGALAGLTGVEGGATLIDMAALHMKHEELPLTSGVATAYLTG